MKAMIVDDEPLARERLRLMLEEIGDVDLLGECADGQQALEAIRSNAPDLVFLDIQMPGLDGLSLAERLTRDTLPLVVFSTAFDEYALQAFEARGIDYLVKPVDPERLRESVDRASKLLRNAGEEPPAGNLVELLKGADPQPRRERLAVRSGNRTVLVRIADIDWIEPVGNYAKLHVGHQSYLLRAALTALEAELDPQRFVRIHRSVVVNVGRITEIGRSVHQGDYMIILSDGTRFEMPRRYAPRLRELIGRF